MARPNDNYYQRRRQAEEEAGQRRFNIEEAMKDKLESQIGGSINEQSTTLTEPLNSPTFGQEYEEIAAPTTNPARPRAYKAGYNPNKKALVIVFRPNQRVNPLTGGYSNTEDPPWVLYSDVDIEDWEQLKNSSSTGEFLKTFGKGWVRLRNPSPNSLPRTRPGEFQSGSQV